MNSSNNDNFNTKILVARIIHPDHIVESVKAGAHIDTIPYKVFKQLFLNSSFTDFESERILGKPGILLSR